MQYKAKRNALYDAQGSDEEEGSIRSGRGKKHGKHKESTEKALRKSKSKSGYVQFCNVSTLPARYKGSASFMEWVNQRGLLAEMAMLRRSVASPRAPVGKVAKKTRRRARDGRVMTQRAMVIRCRGPS